MNDERFLTDWLKDDGVDGSTTRLRTDQIMARVPEVKQRRRWWPLVRARRSPAPTPGRVSDDTERTTLMFSPVKAVVAGVLVFAVGGALFIAQPFDQSTTTAPAASVDRADPVALSADLEWRGGGGPERTEMLPDGTERKVGTWFRFQIVESSDPRFDGNLVFTNTNDVHPGADLQISAARIETDEGAWQETPQYTLNFARQSGDSLTRVFSGEGEYEGLVAVVIDTWRPDGEDAATDIHLDGFILDAELPEQPEAAGTP